MNSCWANSLGDCKGKISKEHIISKGVMVPKITVQGFSWCKDKPVEIGKNSLIGYNLCQKHNTDLSSFDMEAQNFMQVIEKMNKKDADFKRFGFRKADIPIVYKINGYNLECWCCKTLINIINAQNQDFIKYDSLLPFIFQNKHFEKPYGLYFDVTLKSKISSSFDKFISVKPFFYTANGQKELAGFNFTYMGFRLYARLPCSGSEQIVNINEWIPLSNKDIDEIENFQQLQWHTKKFEIIFKSNILQRVNIQWN